MTINAEVDTFLSHHGVKGMHWGVRRSHPSGSSGGVDKHAAKRKEKHDHLIAKAKGHENTSAAHAAAAQHVQKEAADLLKNGQQSAAFKRVYGDNAASQSSLVFYGIHGTNKTQALQETHNNLRLLNNQYTRSANSHAAKAQKLRSKAKQLEHSDIDPDSITDDDPDEMDTFLAHFGVKGMHWGVRKRASTSSHPASEDSARASHLHSKVKTSGGTHVLTNKELEDLTKRLNLEQQYSKFSETSASEIDKGRSFIKNRISDVKIGLDAVDTGRRVYKQVDDAKKAIQK
jgi:hypothetical protein